MRLYNLATQMTLICCANVNDELMNAEISLSYSNNLINNMKEKHQ